MSIASTPPFPTLAPFTWIVIAYAAVNLAGFALFAWDKAAARRHAGPAGRVRERTLHLWAIAGGGIGAFAALLLLRHKSRHAGFWVGATLALSAHVAAWAFWTGR